MLAGFAKAAAYTQISPLNSKNWATADATDAIIPTMMKALMQGAHFTADREQGQHRTAERAQHRHRVDSGTQPPAGGHCRPRPPGTAGRRQSPRTWFRTGETGPRWLTPRRMQRPVAPAPAPPASVAAFVRRHRLAPYLLLAPRWPGIALVLLWPLVQVVAVLVPELRPAADHRRRADAVGGAGQLHAPRSPTLSSGCRCGSRCSSPSSSCRSRWSPARWSACC